MEPRLLLRHGLRSRQERDLSRLEKGASELNLIKLKRGIIVFAGQTDNDLLLTLCRSRQLLLVLQRMGELLGEVFALLAILLLKVSFTHADDHPMLSNACSTDAMVPLGLSLTLALYSLFPWMLRLARSSNLLTVIENRANGADGFCSLERAPLVSDRIDEKTSINDPDCKTQTKVCPIMGQKTVASNPQPHNLRKMGSGSLR